jgi:hypothetical protein
MAVANGDCLSSPGYCRSMKLFVTSELFRIDCYGITLGSYEMVLGFSGLNPWNPSYGTSGSAH